MERGPFRQPGRPGQGWRAHGALGRPVLTRVGDRTGGNGHEVGLLPVGATEQHGPHLPTGTDTILATAICEAVSRGPTPWCCRRSPFGCSYGHGTELPGTFSLTPESLAAVPPGGGVGGVLGGLQRVILVNGHFGNHAALGIATDHLRFHRPDLRVGSRGLVGGDPEVVAAEVLHGRRGHPRQPGRDVDDAGRRPRAGPHGPARGSRRSRSDPGPGLPLHRPLALDERGHRGARHRRRSELGERLFERDGDRHRRQGRGGAGRSSPLQSTRHQRRRGDERASCAFERRGNR